MLRKALFRNLVILFYRYIPDLLQLQEIVSEPKFFTSGVSADDFSQGTLGNCWFVAACACLAEDSKLWKKVCPLTSGNACLNRSVRQTEGFGLIK